MKFKTDLKGVKRTILFSFKYNWRELDRAAKNKNKHDILIFGRQLIEDIFIMSEIFDINKFVLLDCVVRVLCK